MSAPHIEIEKLAFGGAGFGRCDGKACFVPFTVPGDLVEIDIAAEKRSYLSGKVRKLLKASPLRTEPPCPIFGDCGGCQWQHMGYESQLAQKQEIFTEIMARIGRVENAVIEPILAAPSPFFYRSRVQFKVRYVAGAVHLGFYRTGSHFVVKVPGECAVAAPVVNRLLSELQCFMARFPEPDKIPQIDVATGDDGTALVVFHYIGSNHREISSFIGRHRGALLSAAGLWLQSGRKNTLACVAGIDSLTYAVPDECGAPLSLSFSRGGFSQVNLAQNLALISLVRQWSDLTGRERVLDLFCGNGNFSLPLARRAAAVVGVEDYAPSIDDAQENCRKNGIGNATYLCGDAAAEVERRAALGERYDLVILDPPRTGAKSVAETIGSLGAPKIIYISCDPPTLARDCAVLRTQGYEVVRSRPVDMFPQTYHLESITLLECTS